jgi:hypothetical protein
VPFRAFCGNQFNRLPWIPAMNVDTPCPQCGTVFTVRRELVGKRTKCIRCGTIFTIAEAAPAPTPTPPPAIRPPSAPSATGSASAPSTTGPASAQSPPATNYFPEITSPPPTITPLPQITLEPTPRAPHGPARTQSSFPTDSTAQSSFTILKLMARAYEVLALFALAFAVIALLLIAITIIRDPSNLVAALLNGALIFFSSTLTALSLMAFAQTVRLALQIEQNTRQTHQACRQLADHLGAIETEP